MTSKSNANRYGGTVVVDSCKVDPIHLDWEDEDLLNRQTAGNEGPINKAGKCGCFHCGATLSASEVTHWETEWNGSRTGYCPFCGVDALVVGTDEFPLSTSLLTHLFARWFKEELKELAESHLMAPTFNELDDFDRMGIPFIAKPFPEEYEVLGVMELYWPDLAKEELEFDFYDEEGGLFDPSVHLREFQGGQVDVAVLEDCGGFPQAFFIANDGSILCYTYWSGLTNKRVVDYSNKYGKRLKGMVTCINGRAVTLFVLPASELG